MSDAPITPTHRPARRVVEAIMADPWAIHQPALANILAIAEGYGEGAEAVAVRLGRPLDNARDVQVREGGVAIVPVTGPIFRYANMFTDISGATSLSQLALDLQAAVQSPAVSAIVLSIDSPGGEANGLAEMADTIRTAAGIKPLVAYVGGTAASGGYWLAAGAPEIVIARNAELGSIGVVMGMLDTSERDARAGLRRTEFVSSQSPEKRPDLATEAGRASIQARVDRLAAVFVEDVAQWRNVDTTHVIERFGRGGMLVGAAAVAAGMADRIGSLEGTIAMLATDVNSRIARGNRAAAITSRDGVAMSEGNRIVNNTLAPQTAAALGEVPAATPPITTVEALVAAHPALVETVRETAAAAGRKEGAVAERARILGIEAQALPGHETLIAALKADGTTTAEQAAVQVLQAERSKLGGHLQRLQTTAAQVPAIDAGATVVALRDPETRAREVYRRSPELQAEFRNEDRYVAFERQQTKRRA